MLELQAIGKAYDLSNCLGNIIKFKLLGKSIRYAVFKAFLKVL